LQTGLDPHFQQKLIFENWFQELHKYYKGKGESSIKDIARRVGFELPNQRP
jgi:hypothetical protein